MSFAQRSTYVGRHCTAECPAPMAAGPFLLPSRPGRLLERGSRPLLNSIAPFLFVDSDLLSVSLVPCLKVRNLSPFQAIRLFVN